MLTATKKTIATSSSISFTEDIKIGTNCKPISKCMLKLKHLYCSKIKIIYIPSFYY